MSEAKKPSKQYVDNMKAAFAIIDQVNEVEDVHRDKRLAELENFKSKVAERKLKKKIRETSKQQNWVLQFIDFYIF